MDTHTNLNTWKAEEKGKKELNTLPTIEKAPEP